jgi:murein DD-endopeptidase MepM/ murein hydrolase activator NlpD
MYTYKTIMIACSFSLLLSACIPQGRKDYRIGSAPPRSTQTDQSPQIIAENAAVMQTPSWSPAVVERNSLNVEGGSYIVQPGDTLYRIVSNTGASLADIASANNLSAPYVLRTGQQLTIPAGLYHNVGAGETGIAISRAYGVTWSEIISLNALAAPYILNVGQRLRLPASASLNTAAADNSNGVLSPEQRAAGFSLNIDDVVTGGEPAMASAVIAPSSAGGARLDTAVQRPSSFAGNFVWPLDGQLLSRFGSQGGGKVNDGLNIAAAKGTAVRSAGDGVVVYSGNEIGVFGGLILVDHGGGWVTAYGHLNDFQVKRGDVIKSGQAIGSVGETGYVDQPQLHFEIRKDRQPIDPITKLSAR